MRLKLVLVTLVLLFVPAVAKAQTPCWCVNWFADSYVIGAHKDWTQTFTDAQLVVKGVGPINRKRVKEGIYDWQKRRDFSQSWCRANRKACNAVKACLIAAGAAVLADYTKDRAAGNPVNRENMAIDGAFACAAAAAAAFGVS